MTIDYQALRLDKDSAEPLHLQLGRELHRQIKGVAPNQKVKLISERKLSDLLEIDRSTVHRTYSDLLGQGILARNSARFLCVATDARQKQRQPFPNIGIVIPERFSDFVAHNRQMPMHYLNGIFDRTAELNYSTLLLKLPPPETSEAAMREYLQEVVGRLSGVVHLGDRGALDDLPLQMLLEYSAVPQIFISGYSNYAHIGSVAGDAKTGAQSLCEQLREMRHRRIGVIEACECIAAEAGKRLFVYEASDRVAKMMAVFRQYSLESKDEWYLKACCSRDDIFARLASLHQKHDMPTVFWCYNDQVAQQTIWALRELNLSVPDDVSVVGFDGEPVESSGDALTTVKLPFYAIGCRAVELLRDYYEYGVRDENRAVKLPTSLMLRDTLAPARAVSSFV